MVRFERGLRGCPGRALWLDCESLEGGVRRLDQHRGLGALPWAPGPSAQDLYPGVSLCHPATLEPVYPPQGSPSSISPFLGFESSPHPPFLCPESAEDMVRWGGGGPSPSSLWHP